MKNIKMRTRLMILLALAVVLSAATYGFAAANTVDDGYAGEGQGTISGYVVTNVVYTLDSSDPTQFDAVSFSLDQDASDVYAGIGDGSQIYWIQCGGGPRDFNCSLALSTVSVYDAVELHVSSVQ